MTSHSICFPFVSLLIMSLFFQMWRLFPCLLPSALHGFAPILPARLNIVTIVLSRASPCGVGGKVPASSTRMGVGNCAFKLIWVAMWCCLVWTWTVQCRDLIPEHLAGLAAFVEDDVFLDQQLDARQATVRHPQRQQTFVFRNPDHAHNEAEQQKTPRL